MNAVKPALEPTACILSSLQTVVVATLHPPYLLHRSPLHTLFAPCPPPTHAGNGCGVYVCAHRRTVSSFFERELDHLCRTRVVLHVGDDSDAMLAAHHKPQLGPRKQQQQQAQVVVAETIHMKSGGSKPITSRDAISLEPPAARTTTTTSSSSPSSSTKAAGAATLHITPLGAKPPGLIALQSGEGGDAGNSGSGDGHEQDDPPDPRDNLTFNLRLTDEERAVRAQTALPYAKTQEEKQRFLQGTGAIYYEPDDVDDFDDEDPDDDLDI